MAKLNPGRLADLLRRGARAGPVAVARWLVRQYRAEAEQVLTPWRAKRLTVEALLAALGAVDLDGLWQDLGRAPFIAHAGPVDGADYARLCPGGQDRIMAAAEAAVSRRVDLLGSGSVDLGTPIDWHRDFKSGHGWPVVPFRRLDVLDLGRDSDVKVPWELSRLQWLIPAGQAYRLTGEDRFARSVRSVIEEWAAANPIVRGVNWACTMDVALRAMTLVWLFHVFHRADGWRDGAFRGDFLRLLYLHGDFICRHLEWSDVNGNHLTADAAGLVFIGVFFGRGRAPGRWQSLGWEILGAELPRQVLADGVNFEAAAAYHRLALELFLLPALYRRAAGLRVGEPYADTLEKMAEFTLATSRPDGSAPHWGDADDGRALPLGDQVWGGQGLNDHRYLVGLVGLGFDRPGLIEGAAGPRGEAFWLFGAAAAARLSEAATPAASRGFEAGGVFVMRGGGDHVFVDCGPVGLAGRGGHGHNDCLSFEAMLDGIPLITDCGSYVYTASVEWRNRFRGTAYHNTPMIDGAEQNRLVGPETLWSLHDDAAPEVRRWEPGPERDVFIGAHSGYRRLADPVTPVRAMVLDKQAHRLVVADRFEGTGTHRVSIPYHLAPAVVAEQTGPRLWRLTAGGTVILLVWQGDDTWTADLAKAWFSPSYGVKQPTTAITFTRQGPLARLAVGLLPAAHAPADPAAWLARFPIP